VEAKNLVVGDDSHVTWGAMAAALVAPVLLLMMALAQWRRPRLLTVMAKIPVMINDGDAGVVIMQWW
jgi:hypothetical protein